MPPAAQGRSSAPRRTCCSSPPREQGRWSRRSRTSARPATGSSSSRRGASASAGSQIAERYGCAVTPLRYEWGEIPSAGRSRLDACRLERSSSRLPHAIRDVDRSRRRHPGARGGRAGRSGAHVVVDAVSSLGAVPLEVDAWGDRRRVFRLAEGADDAAGTGHGLRLGGRLGARGPLILAPLLLRLGANTRAPRTQLDSAFTPATSLVVGFNVALGLILETGLEATFERHRLLGRACREGVKAMGLELFSPDNDTSAVVTAIKAPGGLDATEIVRALRDHHGIQIANGQAALKGPHLPDRPHRLLRRLRHCDGTGRARARR